MDIQSTVSISTISGISTEIAGTSETQLCTSNDGVPAKQTTRTPEVAGLVYSVDDIPPWPVSIMFAIQVRCLSQKTVTDKLRYIQALKGPAMHIFTAAYKFRFKKQNFYQMVFWPTQNSRINYPL